MIDRFEAVLCGYYGFGNLGDELLAKAFISLYGKNGITADRLAILSAEPEKSLSDHGIHAVDRWDFRQVWQVLHNSRTLLLGGGGLFQDRTSIRSCLYYWGVIRMALLAGCRVWMFGQSVGPLRSGFARFFARDGIRRCQVRVVRDRSSTNILANWGLDASMAPDPVLNLVSDPVESSRGEYILVNIRPWVDQNIPDSVFYKALEISSREKLPIRMVAMSPEDVGIVRNYLSLNNIKDIEIENVSSLEDVSRIWKRAKFAFGMRLHFCILSLLSGVPCLAVPYDPKVEGFCSTHAMPVWNMKDYPDLGSLQVKSSRSMLLAESREIEEIFSRSLKEVCNLR